MILAIHSDPLDLSKPKARGQVGGHFFLSGNKKCPPKNVAIHNITKVIMVIMSSAPKAKVGTLFINAKHMVAIWATLAEMGYPQLPHPNRQLNSNGHHYQQNPPKSDESHGHAIPLAKRKNDKISFTICGDLEQ